MRKPRPLSQLSLVLLSITRLTSATGLQLPTVQPIVGFSSSCISAYSARLPSCELSMLLGSVGGENGGCSVSCVSELTILQSDVQSECQGERATRETVIGQMFLGTVVDFLCGGDVGAGGSSSASQTAPQTTSSASSMTVPTTSMSEAAPIDSSTSSETTTSDDTTTTTEESTATSTTLTSQTSTAVTTSSATATASNSQNGASGDGEATFDGSGGGSPFDGGSSNFEGAAARLSLRDSPLALLSALAALLLLR